MARRSKQRGNSRKVDFSQEVQYFEPDMEVELEVKSATWEDGNEHPYLAIVFKGAEEEYEESELYHNASISPKALKRTRLLLEALGVDIPEKGGDMDLDSDELVGLRCMAHTYEDRYTGNDGEKKTSVKADDFWSVDDKKPKKKSSSKKDDDEKKSSKGGRKSKKEEPEKIAKTEVEEMDDRDDLEGLIETYSLDIDPEERKFKKDDKLKEAIIEALEEGDFLEEEEEEEKTSKKRGRGKTKEEEEPKGKGSRSSGGKRGSKGKSKKWSTDDIQDMNEEELDDVVEQAELDIDLGDHKTLRKKKNAVIDALEEAEKLED